MTAASAREGSVAHVAAETGAMEALTAMGFDEGAAREALERCGGDAGEAADWLVTKRSQSQGGKADATGDAGPSSASGESAPEPEEPESSRIRIFVESCGGIKDGAKLHNLQFAVTLITAAGKPLEPQQTTPIGSATVRPDGTVLFGANIDMRTTYDRLPKVLNPEH